MSNFDRANAAYTAAATAGNPSKQELAELWRREYATKAAGDAAAATPLSDNQEVIIAADESRAGQRTLYRVQGGALQFVRLEPEAIDAKLAGYLRAFPTLAAFTAFQGTSEALPNGSQAIILEDGTAGTVAGATLTDTVTLGAGATPPQTAFYVDSNTGSDSNDGTQATPFLTLGQAETAANAVGNNAEVYLVAGSEWRETLQLTGSNVKVLGTGDFAGSGFPIVRGDDVVTNADFEDSTQRGDGDTNLHRLSVAVEGQSGLGSFGIQIWEGDNALMRVADQATAQATPGTFYSPQHSVGNPIGITSEAVEIFIHPAASNDPKTNGLTYEVGKRNFGITVPDGGEIGYVTGMRAAHNNGSLQAGRSSRIHHALARGGLRHQMLMSSGEFDTVFAEIEHYDTNSGHIAVEFFVGNGQGDDCTARNVAVLNSSTDPDSENAKLFGGHTSSDPGDEYGNWLLQGMVGNKGIVIAGDAANFRIEEMVFGDGMRLITDNVGPVEIINALGPKGDATTTGNFIEDNVQSNDVLIDGLRMYRDMGTSAPTFTVAKNVTVQNCVMVDEVNVGGLRRNFITTQNDVNLTLTNSVFASLSTDFAVGREIRFTYDLAAGTFAGSNNVYWPEQANQLEVRDGGTPANFNSMSAWLAARQPGDEVGSVISDPAIADPANGDFTIGGAGLPAGVGPQGAAPTYLTLPPNTAAAEAWILANP